MDANDFHVRVKQSGVFHSLRFFLERVPSPPRDDKLSMKEACPGLNREALSANSLLSLEQLST